MNLNSIKFSNSLVVLCLSVLLFTLPIPGTNALRYLCAITLLCISLWISYNQNLYSPLLKNSFLRSILIILIVLTGYIFLHTLYQSHEIEWSLSEFKGHWLVPIAFLLLGLLLCNVFEKNFSQNSIGIINLVFFAIFFHILYVDFIALDYFLSDRELPRRIGALTAGPDNLNYLTNILFSIATADLISRKTIKRRIIMSSDMFLLFMISCLIVSSYLAETRNGYISIIMISIISIYFYYRKNDSKLKKKTAIVSLLILLLAFGSLFFADKRSKDFIETFYISLDTDKYDYWITRSGQPPILNDGSKVSDSNYLRMTWIIKSLEYLYHNPNGIGFGRNAFGHAIEIHENNSSARGTHSHSAILDFSLGVGLLGLFFWVAYIAFILIKSHNSFINNSNPYALASFLLIFDFFLRSFIDSNMRDHYFQMFFLVTGIFLMKQIIESQDKHEKENISY